MNTGHCVVCGGLCELLPHTQPGRSEECPQCHANLHSCRQCRFYDVAYRNACREPRAEYVGDKTAANFCDWFEFHGGTGAVDPEHQRAEEAKRKLKELFK